MKRLVCIQKILFLFLTLFLYMNCARIASPPGGPKDETPPRIKKSVPENLSVNFSSRNIEIEFDEYIKFNDISQLITSPPMKEKPEIKLKGKGLQIKLNEELQDNTTYTINFGNAIVDNNESNAIENFQYVFSTGPDLDSLSLAGKVVNAFDHSLAEDVYILLYENLSDSTIYNEKPLYLTKTDKRGYFKINNLKEGDYQVFALEDVNRNYIYEPPEKLSFIDSVIHLDADFKTDTISLSDSLGPVPEMINLYLFEEVVPKQYIESSTRISDNNILLVFNEVLIKEPGFSLPGYSEKDNWFIIENYIVGDSIGLWITDTAIINLTRLNLEIKYPLSGVDTGLFYTDTISLSVKKNKSKGNRKALGKSEMETKPEPQTTNLNLMPGSGNILDLNKAFWFESRTPVNNIDTSRISLFEIVDSVETKLNFRLAFNKRDFRRLFFKTDWKEGTDYRIKLYPGAVNDIYDNKNDSTEFSFKTRKMDEYGSIIMEMQEIEEEMIIQLLDEKNNILRSISIKSDTILNFEFLQPKTYRIKAILDKNKNGKWDTGSWLKKLQPEKIDFYIEEIKLRSNWEFTKTWKPDPQ